MLKRKDEKILRAEDLSDKDRKRFENQFLSVRFLRDLSSAINALSENRSKNLKKIFEERKKKRYIGEHVNATYTEAREIDVDAEKVLQDFTKEELEKMGVFKIKVDKRFLEFGVEKVKEKIDSYINKFEKYISKKLSGQRIISSELAEKLIDEFVENEEIKYPRIKSILQDYLNNSLTEEKKGEEARERVKEYEIVVLSSRPLRITPKKQIKQRIFEQVEREIKRYTGRYIFKI